MHTNTLNVSVQQPWYPCREATSPEGHTHYIGRCEAGKQNATLKTIYSLAAVLEVEATDLLPPMSEADPRR